MSNQSKPKVLDPFMVEEGCLDTKELLLSWGLPHFVPILPTPKSVRKALKYAGYRVRYFIREKKKGKQVNELGLQRVSAPFLEDDQLLTEHFVEILRGADVEVAPENVVVYVDDRHADRLWLGFSAILY